MTKQKLPRPKLKRWILAVLAPIVFVASAEIILWLADAGHPTSFLIPMSIGSRQVMVDNQFFGYRFFPKRMARTTPTIVMDRAKPGNTIRVVVLGGSAAMGDPLKDFGLARHLDILLKARFPQQSFDVINAAMTAINSHVVTEIARDISRHDPDIIVVYMGNNEIVGPYGAGTVFSRYSGSYPVTRARILASRLRLGGLLRDALTRNEAGVADEWLGVEMFAKNEMDSTDPRVKRTYDLFRRNLDTIVRTAQRAGSEVFVSTVAVNLRDNPPFAKPQVVDSIQPFSEAQRLEAEGQFAQARELYQTACDLDRLRLRADSGINSAVRDVAESTEAHLVDAVDLFMQATTNAAPGFDYFVDHVHFTFEGNYLLASKIVEQIESLPSLADKKKGRRLGVRDTITAMMYTPWDELEMVVQLWQRLHRAPFTGQPGNRERLGQLAARQKRLAGVIRMTDMSLLRTRFGQAFKADPYNWIYPQQWGQILADSDRFEEAIEALRVAVALAPHRYDIRAKLAQALAFSGRPEEGVEVLVRNSREGRILKARILQTKAMTLIQFGKKDEARVFLEAARELDPNTARGRDESNAGDADTAHAKVEAWD